MCEGIYNNIGQRAGEWRVGSVGSVGNVLRMQGRLAEAMAKHERALAIKEAALGPEHKEVATTLVNMEHGHPLTLDARSACRHARSNVLRRCPNRLTS